MSGTSIIAKFSMSLNIFFLQVLALFAIRSILSGLKKLCLLKSEYDQEMSQLHTAD